MAIQTLQLCAVLTIGLSLASATLNAAAKETTSEIPLTLHLAGPADVTVARGRPAVLHCGAKNARQVRWLYNGTLIPEKDGRWHMYKNGSLLVPKVAGKRVAATLEGSYRCLARNADGAVLSNAAKLKIATMKDFSKQPQDVNVTEFQSVFIPCSIISTPNVSKHWERDDSPLPQSTRYVPLPTGLLITSTHSSDVGSYRCKVVNTILKKSKSSKPGRIAVAANRPDVVVPPAILPLDLEFNVTVLVGNDVTLYCAVNGWPTPTIRWLNNNGVVIANSTVLVLHAVGVNMTGKYTCTAFNSGGHTSKTYYLSVHRAPYFNVTPVSQVNPTAKTIRLDCQADGVPEPKISWYKNGVLFDVNDTFGRAHVQPSGLLISHSVASDAGVYQCVATNSAGTAWAPGLVRLIYSNNSPSAPVDVHCQAFNDTAVCLQWSRIPNAQAYSILAYHSGMRLKDYITADTYKLANNLVPNANYTFSVRTYSKEASNEFMHVTCTTGVRGSRNLQIEKYGETSVRLTWSEISMDNNPCVGSNPTRYKILWRNVNQTLIHANSQQELDLTKIILGLQPGQTYEFRVQSNKEGASTSSTWSAFTLPESSHSSNDSSSNELNATIFNDTSPIVPVGLDAVALSANSINLTWTDTNIADVFYTVCYAVVAEERDCDSAKLIKSKYREIEIRNLKPNTEYEFRVRAQNVEGMSSAFSYSIQLTTPSDVPSSVQGLKYKILNTTSACVRWEPPLYKNGKLTGYLIKYSPNNSWPLEKWFRSNIVVSQRHKGCWTTDPYAYSITLQDLDPDNQYMVIVIAMNDVGAGNPTIPITLSTKYPFDSEKSPSISGSSYYKQGVGVVLGLSVSVLLVLFIAMCFLLKSKLHKVRAVTRGQLSGGNHVGVGTANGRQTACGGDSHEMQHLVEANGVVGIPIIQPAHLDTKGGTQYPNGHVNGNTKRNYFNGTVPNQVHITENPQFFSNGPSSAAHSDHESYEEDSNSNLQRLSLKKPILHVKTSPICARSYNSSMDSNLDATQLTQLDDLLGNESFRPVVGPNG